MQTIN